MKKAPYSAADYYLQIREQGAFGILFSLTHPNGHSSEYLMNFNGFSFSTVLPFTVLA